MFEKHSNIGYVSPMEGIKRKTLVYGQKTLMCEFVLEKGSSIAKHSHPHEQTGYLVKGRLRFSVDKEEYDAQPGDSWCFPGGVEHSVEVMEDSVVIEIFSPVREEFLPEQRLK